MEPKTEPRDEYLHKPLDRRLYNESYYFDFNDEEVQGFTRLGFQPFERRVNAWFYAVHNGNIYWFRDEDIRQEDCFGLHLHTPDYEQSYVLEEPYKHWTITASGTVSVASNPEAVYRGSGEQTQLEAEITFKNPLHEALDIDLLVDTQYHYDHAGRTEGTLTLGSDTIEVSGVGYRDHSWGWYRDWTPGKYGHIACFAQFETTDSFVCIASTDPDDNVRHAYGYHANNEGLRALENASVAWNDGLDRAERAETWATGDYPKEPIFTLEFGDGTEELHFNPHHNIPIGYEDRNWALTDPDGPWLKSITNRMPARVEWSSNEGFGWSEELLSI